MKVASFFSGIGGFDIGFEKAGMQIVFQCELNQFGRDILKKYWSDVELFSDINKVKVEDIPDSELWCGGFPCQDLSLANQGKRKGLKGDRSGLFFRFAELLERRKPRWIVIENVPGLLNSHEGKDFQILLKTLDEFGYCISWRVLDAKYFGTPQRRRRVFIVGSFGNIGSTKVLFDSERTPIITESSNGTKQASSSNTRKKDQATNIFVIQHASIGRKHTAGPQAKGYRNDGEAYTLDSRGSSDAICQANDSFRIREASRFPRTLDGVRFRSIGNAVAVPVVYWIAKRIAEVDLQLTNR